MSGHVKSEIRKLNVLAKKKKKLNEARALPWDTIFTLT